MAWRRGAGPLDGSTWRRSPAILVRWREANPLDGAGRIITTSLVPPIPVGVIVSRVLRNDGGAILMNDGTSKVRLN